MVVIQEFMAETNLPKSQLTSVLKQYCDKHTQGELMHYYTLKK